MKKVMAAKEKQYIYLVNNLDRSIRELEKLMVEFADLSKKYNNNLLKADQCMVNFIHSIYKESIPSSISTILGNYTGHNDFEEIKYFFSGASATDRDNCFRIYRYAKKMYEQLTDSHVSTRLTSLDSKRRGLLERIEDLSVKFSTLNENDYFNKENIEQPIFSIIKENKIITKAYDIIVDNVIFKCKFSNRLHLRYIEHIFNGNDKLLEECHASILKSEEEETEEDIFQKTNDIVQQHSIFEELSGELKALKEISPSGLESSVYSEQRGELEENISNLNEILSSIGILESWVKRWDPNNFLHGDSSIASGFESNIACIRNGIEYLSFVASCEAILWWQEPMDTVNLAWDLLAVVRDSFKNGKFFSNLLTPEFLEKEKTMTILIKMNFKHKDTKIFFTGLVNIDDEHYSTDEKGTIYYAMLRSEFRSQERTYLKIICEGFSWNIGISSLKDGQTMLFEVPSFIEETEEDYSTDRDDCYELESLDLKILPDENRQSPLLFSDIRLYCQPEAYPEKFAQNLYSSSHTSIQQEVPTVVKLWEAQPKKHAYSRDLSFEIQSKINSLTLTPAPSFAFRMPLLPQSVVNIAAGYGDGVSFGLTQWVIEKLGTDGVVDRNSNTYNAALLAGVATPYSASSARIAYLASIGKKYKFGKNLKIAPFGNRTGHPTGELPHYHRRNNVPPNGQVEPGQGLPRHRPWDSSKFDKSFKDRF
jgi:hypothetical protein